MDWNLGSRLLVAKRKQAKWSAAKSKVGSRWMAEWLAKNRTEQNRRRTSLSLSLIVRSESQRGKDGFCMETEGRTDEGGGLAGLVG